MNGSIECPPVDDARRFWNDACDKLRGQSFAVVPGVVLGVEAGVARDAWNDFADHWNRLALDRHMGDGGRYRLRRYGQFDTRSDGSLRLLPHEPYEQSRAVNPLNGGVPRFFEPLEPSFASHRVLHRILDRLRAMVDRASGQRSHWNVRLHPYRVLADEGTPGLPTPEGLHSDGVDFVMSMLVERRNVLGGQTTVTDSQGEVLGTTTLAGPMHLLVTDDTRTMHAVSPIKRAVVGKAAWRDVLVIAFTRRGAS